MGRGQPSPQASTHSPWAVLHCRARPGPGRQHPRTPLVPPEQAELAWPGPARGCRTVLLQWSKAWLNSPGMHCLGQGESRDRPQVGWRGAQSRGALPHGAPAAPTLTKGTGAGNALSRTTMHTLESREERERRGVYTFENCQPCRVMGDPNRITRQTCILPSILK